MRGTMGHTRRYVRFQRQGPNSPAATSERPSAADDRKVSGLYAAMTLQASAIFVTRSLTRATGHELGGGRLRESRFTSSHVRYCSARTRWATGDLPAFKSA